MFLMHILTQNVDLSTFWSPYFLIRFLVENKKKKKLSTKFRYLINFKINIQMS